MSDTKDASGSRNVSIGGNSTGGVVVTGDGNTVRTAYTDVQSGGIRAGKIDAENVVDGVQIRGGDAASAAELIRLASEIRRGGITADEIRAGNVVTGLQYIADPAAAGMDDLRREVAALRERLESAAADGDFPDETDAEDAVGEIAAVETELEKPEPAGKRIVRRLNALSDILTQSGEMLQAAGNVKSKVMELLPYAAAVGLTAQAMFGG